MRKDITLDCFGLLCPMPIVKTAQAVKKLKKGKILEVIADDPGIEKDMPAWCESTGNKCLGIEKGKDKIIRAYVKKMKD